MGAYLTLSISESDLDKSENTSKVKATLYCHSNSGSWNGSSRSGYIEIDGSKHSFSSSFKSNTTTTLSSYTKTVKHDSDGGGKITIKGYYSTGVSAGNISTSKSYTLKQIDRTYTVKYHANGGSDAPANQTKTYGKTLTLRTAKPSKTGYIFKNWNTKANGNGKNYSPGASYTANSDLDLYAQWEEEEYTIKFKTTYVNTPSTIKLKYSDTSKVWPTPTLKGNGYGFSSWQEQGGTTIFYPGNAIQSSKGGAKNKDGKTFVSNEIRFYSTILFRDQQANIKNTTRFNYGDTVYFPSPQSIGISIPENKKFIGWNSSIYGNGTNTSAGSAVVWQGAKEFNDSYSYYAILKDKDSLSIEFLNIDKIIGNSVPTFSSGYVDTVNYGSDYTITNPISPKNVDDYMFTGYWSINKPAEFKEWSEYNLPSKYVFPYSFNPSFTDHYNEYYDIVDNEYVINHITENTTLYPVFKEASNISEATQVKSSSDYIDRNDFEGKSVKNEYLNYLSGQSTSFDILLTGEYFVAALKIHASSVGIDTNKTKNSCVITLFDTDLEQDFCTFNAIDDEVLISKKYENGEIFYYFIVSNLDDNKPTINPSTKYTISTTGIYDDLGKVVVTKDFSLYPPNIIRDINSKGNVVSFFGGAKENPSKSSDTPEFWINGNLVVTDDVYTGTGSDGYLAKSRDIEDILSYVWDEVHSGDLTNGYGLIQAIRRLAFAISAIETALVSHGWYSETTVGVTDIWHGYFKKNDTFYEFPDDNVIGG